MPYQPLTFPFSPQSVDKLNSMLRNIFSKTIDTVWMDYIPAFGGFSSNPVNGIYRYFLHNYMCACVIRMPYAGTSNSTSFTITLPRKSKNINQYYQGFPCAVVDNSSSLANPGVIEIAPDSTVASVYTNLSGGSWTASGSKRIRYANFVYEID